METTASLAQPALPPRPGVLVVDDASYLSRRVVAVADMVAAQCSWPLAIVSRRRADLPPGLETPRERCQIIASVERLATGRPRRRGDILVVGVPKGWEASPLEAQALRAAAQASCSIWLARDDLSELRAARAPRRILVGAGQSPSASRVLATAAKIAASFGAVLTIAEVVAHAAYAHTDPALVEDDALQPSICSAHERMLARWRRASPAGPQPHLVFPVGDVADTLVSLSGGFDLIIVGRGDHARSAWEPGSVAARVACDADCSVLIVA